MILLMAETETQNILHVVQGPESELHYAVHGNVIINISTLLAQMNGEKPVLLHFTKCDSEAEKSAHLAMLSQRGSVYPFQAQTAVFGPKARLEAAMQQAEENKKEKIEKMTAPERGTCTRCGTQDCNDLVPGLQPTICYSCTKIDLGLAKAKKAAKT